MPTFSLERIAGLPGGKLAQTMHNNTARAEILSFALSTYNDGKLETISLLTALVGLNLGNNIVDTARGKPPLLFGGGSIGM
jgi:hypothetical protein